jgi:raffinose/stachyose/melibiose transport system substrate-binding protein
MTISITRRLLLAAAAGTALTLAFAAPSFAETTLSISSDGNAETTAALDALTKAFMAANADVKFELPPRRRGRR